LHDGSEEGETQVLLQIIRGADGRVERGEAERDAQADPQPDQQTEQGVRGFSGLDRHVGTSVGSTSEALPMRSYSVTPVSFSRFSSRL
jgi:hypothetical protein